MPALFLADTALPFRDRSAEASAVKEEQNMKSDKKMSA